MLKNRSCSNLQVLIKRKFYIKLIEILAVSEDIVLDKHKCSHRKFICLSKQRQNSPGGDFCYFFFVFRAIDYSLEGWEHLTLFYDHPVYVFILFESYANINIRKNIWIWGSRQKKNPFNSSFKYITVAIIIFWYINGYNSLLGSNATKI